MAIIIEEETNKISIVSILSWLAVLVIIGVAVYYVFFTKPQLVEVAAPPNFKDIDPLAKISLNPEDVVNSQAFQSLKPYVTIGTPEAAGRQNPFLPF